MNSEVLPVSVVSPSELHWPFELVVPLRDQLVRITDQTLVPVLKKLDLEGVRDPRIVIQDTSSVREAAGNLIESAERQGADLIAVNTHSRRGFDRLRLGSFAEALVSMSPIPVLTVNPKTQVPQRLETLLFATDFSPGSRRAFKRVMEYASEFEARIVLFHKIESPVAPMVYGDGTVVIDPGLIEMLVRDAEVDRKKRAELWIAAARKRGIDCEALVSKSFGSTSDAILRASRDRNASVIVVGGYRGVLAPFLLGSVTREVLLDASRPVLVLPSSIRSFEPSVGK